MNGWTVSLAQQGVGGAGERGVDRRDLTLPSNDAASPGSSSRDIGEARLVVPGEGVRENASESSFDLGMSMLVGFGVLAAAGLVVGASWLGTISAARRIERADPAEAAFRTLCRRLRLSRSQRGVLRRAAAAMECRPVALVVSVSAIERAVGMATPATLGELEMIRRKVSA